MHIVLVNPDMPGNAGNVGRTCVALGATLHLVHPMGFVLDEKKIKRAGLDYWQHLNYQEHESLAAFERSFLPGKQSFLFSRFAQRPHWDFDYWSSVEAAASPVLIFGSESKGLPDPLKQKYPDSLVQIPVPGLVRSLNLATSVGIAAYEVFRQKQQSSE